MVDLSGLEQTVRCPICYGEALHGSAAGWYVAFAVSVGSGAQCASNAHAGMLKNTRLSMVCGHRFCAECLDHCLRREGK